MYASGNVHWMTRRPSWASRGMWPRPTRRTSTGPLPHPENPVANEEPTTVIERVMAITDHLAGDHRLVNYAAAVTPAAGCLYLTHVEDKGAFQRYGKTIGKIPEIETEKAQEQILNQLLKEPREYIGS